MRKFAIQAILLVVVIFGALYAFHVGTQNLSINTPVVPSGDYVIINGVKVNIEIANTPVLRRIGLGGRDSLATNSGMLFVFDTEGTQSFWMKGMRFPLDILWLRNDKVVDITKKALPPAPGQSDADLLIYVPREPVTKVLEVNAGFVDAHGIKIGDKLETSAAASSI